MTITIDGSATAADAKTYRLLPFEMPEGAAKLFVRYQFGQEIGQGGGIIDIGVFDARGGDFLTEGFRGWSGSARREFYITTSSATPGYTPGALMPGTWFVCMGLYEIGDEGCGYHVEIDVETGQPETVIEPAYLPLRSDPRPERRTDSGWYKGELHCHTYHSDGDSDPLYVIQRAEALGLDFLAITDHNVLMHRVAMRTADTPLMLIPGTEVTTYRGHWNVWGDHGWIDFRVEQEADMRRSMEEAMRRGYLVSCNHPKQYGPPWEYADIETYHCVEVWNGPWEFLNEESLAFWDDHLRAGKRYSAVGGSDCHFHNREHHAKLAQPTTYIHCAGDPSPARLLNSLKAGAAFVTEAPDGPQVYLTCGDAIVGQSVPQSDALTFNVRVVDGAGSTLQLIGGDGVLLEVAIDAADWRTDWTAPPGTGGYVRAQLMAADGKVRALTNPIYLTDTVE